MLFHAVPFYNQVQQGKEKHLVEDIFKLWEGIPKWHFGRTLPYWHYIGGILGWVLWKGILDLFGWYCCPFLYILIHWIHPRPPSSFIHVQGHHGHLGHNGYLGHHVHHGRPGWQGFCRARICKFMVLKILTHTQARYLKHPFRCTSILQRRHVPSNVPLNV